MRRLFSNTWAICVFLAIAFSSTVWAQPCPPELLKFAQIQEMLAQGTPGAQELLQFPAPFLRDSFAQLEEHQSIGLTVLYPEAFGYFQHHLLKTLYAETPDRVSPRVKLEDTWSEWLVLESLQSPTQIPLRDHLGLAPIDLSSRPVVLSEAHRQLRSQHWISADAVPLFWSPVFSHLEWLKQFGCSRENGVQSWLSNTSCLGTLRSLYGALTEAWLLAPRENWIPGGAIRVGGKLHADGWRISFEGGHLVLESLTEIKPSLVRFHARGMYQIHGFLERLLEPGARIEVYGQKIDTGKLRIRTKHGLVSLPMLRSLLGAQHFEKSSIVLPGAEAPPIAYDGRWGGFVKQFEATFEPEFFESVLPKDEVPYVASHLVHLQNRPVGIQTPGLFTLAQNRQRFIQFMASVMGDPESEPLLSAAIFLKETHEHRDLLVHVAVPGTSGIAEPTPTALENLDPRIKNADYAAILEEAVHRDVSYHPLEYPANTQKREFLLRVLMPYAGWRTLLSAPSAFRQVAIDDTSLTIEPYGSMMPLRVEWVPQTILSAPVWETTGVRTLKIPHGYRWPSDSSLFEFFDYGLVNHDLHRFTAPEWVERQRAGLGEPRVILKPGQKYILDRFRTTLDANPNTRLEVYIQGPMAYGKTLILHEALKDLIRRSPSGTTKRNLFFVVTGQKRLVEQISTELKRKRAHDLSEPVDFTHLSWETGNSRQQFGSLSEIADKAALEAASGRTVVVTVNWSYLNQRTKESSPEAIERLKNQLAGFFIDEANQAGADSNLNTVSNLTENVPEMVLWGQEAVGINRKVIQDIFHGNIWWVVPTENENQDPVQASLSQMTRSVRDGLIAPMAENASDKVLMHFTPEQLVRNRALPKGAQPRMIYRTIADATHREALYGYLANDLDQMLLRHRGLIRVENQQQASDLANYLQAYLHRARELEPSRPQRTIRAYFDGSPDHDGVYRGLSKTEGADRVDWAVVVKQFDGGIDIPHLSGLVLITEKIDPETFLEFLGRSLRLYPGKAPVEIVQISAAPSLPESLLAGLKRKQEALDAAVSSTTGVPSGDIPPVVLDTLSPVAVPQAPAPEAVAQVEAKRRIAFSPIGILPELTGSRDQILISQLARLAIHFDKPKLQWVQNHPEAELQYQTEMRILLESITDLAPNSVLSDFIRNSDSKQDPRRFEVWTLFNYLLAPVMDEFVLVHRPAQPPAEPRVFEAEYELGIYEGGEERILRYVRAGPSTQFTSWPPTGYPLENRLNTLQARWPEEWQDFPQDTPLQSLAFGITELTKRSHQFAIELARWLSIKANQNPDPQTVLLWTARFGKLIDCYRALLPNEPNLEAAARRVAFGSFDLQNLLVFAGRLQTDLRLRYSPLERLPLQKTWTARLFPLPDFEVNLHADVQKLESASAVRPKTKLNATEIHSMVDPWLDHLGEKLPGERKLVVEAYEFLKKVQTTLRRARDTSSPIDWQEHFEYAEVTPENLVEEPTKKLVVIRPGELGSLSGNEWESKLAWVVKAKALLDPRKYALVESEMKTRVPEGLQRRVFLNSWRVLEIIRLDNAVMAVVRRFGVQSELAKALISELDYLKNFVATDDPSNLLSFLKNSPVHSRPLSTQVPFTFFLKMIPSTELITPSEIDLNNPDSIMDRLLGYPAEASAIVASPLGEKTRRFSNVASLLFLGPQDRRTFELDALVRVVGPRLSAAPELEYEVRYSPEILLDMDAQIGGTPKLAKWPLTEQIAKERVATLKVSGPSALDQFANACAALHFYLTAAGVEAERASWLLKGGQTERIKGLIQQADLYLREGLRLSAALFGGDERLALLKRVYEESYSEQSNHQAGPLRQSELIQGIMISAHHWINEHYFSIGTSNPETDRFLMRASRFASVQKEITLKQLNADIAKLDRAASSLSGDSKPDADWLENPRQQIGAIVNPWSDNEGLPLPRDPGEMARSASQFMREILNDLRQYANTPDPLPLVTRIAFAPPSVATLQGEDPFAVVDLPLSLSTQEIAALQGERRRLAVAALFKRIVALVVAEPAMAINRAEGIGVRMTAFMSAWSILHRARLADATRGLEALLGSECDLVRLLREHIRTYTPNLSNTASLTAEFMRLRDTLWRYYPTLMVADIQGLKRSVAPLTLPATEKLGNWKRMLGYSPHTLSEFPEITPEEEFLMGAGLARPIDNLLTLSFEPDLEERLRKSSVATRTALRDKWLAQNPEAKADRFAAVAKTMLQLEFMVAKIRQKLDVKNAIRQVQETDRLRGILLEHLGELRSLLVTIFPEDPLLAELVQDEPENTFEVEALLKYLDETYFLSLLQAGSPPLHGEYKPGNFPILTKPQALGALKLIRWKSENTPHIPLQQPTGVEAAKAVLDVIRQLEETLPTQWTAETRVGFVSQLQLLHHRFTEPVWGKKNAFVPGISALIEALSDGTDASGDETTRRINRALNDDTFALGRLALLIHPTYLTDSGEIEEQELALLFSEGAKQKVAALAPKPNQNAEIADAGLEHLVVSQLLLMQNIPSDTGPHIRTDALKECLRLALSELQLAYSYDPFFQIAAFKQNIAGDSAFTTVGLLALTIDRLFQIHAINLWGHLYRHPLFEAMNEIFVRRPDANPEQIIELLRTTEFKQQIPDTEEAMAVVRRMHSLDRPAPTDAKQAIELARGILRDPYWTRSAAPTSAQATAIQSLVKWMTVLSEANSNIDRMDKQKQAASQIAIASMKASVQKELADAFGENCSILARLDKYEITRGAHVMKLLEMELAVRFPWKTTPPDAAISQLFSPSPVAMKAFPLSREQAQSRLQKAGLGEDLGSAFKTIIETLALTQNAANRNLVRGVPANGTLEPIVFQMVGALSALVPEDAYFSALLESKVWKTQMLHYGAIHILCEALLERIQFYPFYGSLKTGPIHRPLHGMDDMLQRVTTYKTVIERGPQSDEAAYAQAIGELPYLERFLDPKSEFSEEEKMVEATLHLDKLIQP